MDDPVAQLSWEIDCVGHYGEVLQGKFCHYCDDWDSMPLDETCMEFSVCTCEVLGWDMAEANTHREALRAEREATPPLPAPQETSELPLLRCYLCEDEEETQLLNDLRTRLQRSHR